MQNRGSNPSRRLRTRREVLKLGAVILASLPFAEVTFAAPVPTSSETLQQAPGTYTIRQKSSGRFVDAYQNGEDFGLVTRPPQDGDSQHWVFSQVGVVHTIRQKSSGRFMDAYQSDGEGFRMRDPLAPGQRQPALGVVTAWRWELHHPATEQRSVRGRLPERRRLRPDHPTAPGWRQPALAP